MEKGQQIRVVFWATLPVKASDEAIREWIRFKLHNTGSMPESPVADHDLQAYRVTFGNI